MQGFLMVISAATVLGFLGYFYIEPSQLDHGKTQLEEFKGTLQSLWLEALNKMGLSEKLEPLNEESARELYCKQELDTKLMFGQISRQVLNQEKALATLEEVMKSSGNRSLTSIALIGPPGVGKSLTAMALRQHFPWQENVQTYSWSTYVPDEVLKFHMIRSFVEFLSDCGQNLLIIDNLYTVDYGLVSSYNKFLNEGKLVNQTIIVIYILSLEMEYSRKQLESLLPVDTIIINYRTFGRDELTDCLQQELRLEKRFLNQRKISLILENALSNVQYAGCKNLRQQVLQYGRDSTNRCLFLLYAPSGTMRKQKRQTAAKPDDNNLWNNNNKNNNYDNNKESVIECKWIT